MTRASVLAGGAERGPERPIPTSGGPEVGGGGKAGLAPKDIKSQINPLRTNATPRFCVVYHGGGLAKSSDKKPSAARRDMYIYSTCLRFLFHPTSCLMDLAGNLEELLSKPIIYL